MWIIKGNKIKCFYPPRILEARWCISSCLHTLPRENWFQYVRREYATAINFPCISALSVFAFMWLSRYICMKTLILNNCCCSFDFLYNTWIFYRLLSTKNKKVKTMLNCSNMTFSRLFLVFCYGYSNFIVL